MIVLPPVSRKFQNSDAHFELVIPEISLASGELTYIVGPNGSGKSLYLRSLVEDRIEGGDSWRRSAVSGLRGHAILLRQDPDENLAHSLTAQENLALWSHPKSVLQWLFPSRFAARELHEATADFPSLKRVLDRSVGTLSGGQKQALVMLSRLGANGNLVLMDEITSSIDSSSSQLMLELLSKRVKASGLCTLISAHDIHEIGQFADRVIILSKGKLFDDFRRPPGLELDEDGLASQLAAAWRNQVLNQTPLFV